MAVRTRRRSTFRQTTVVNNEPPTPANAAAVWWADDIAQSDGSAVASWTDRVNNISVSQATSGARPTYDIDGLNGRSSVSFDGIDDYLSFVASDAVSVATQGCVVAVIRRTSGDGRVWSSAQHVAGPNYITGRFSSGAPAISQSSNGGTNEDLVMGQTSAGTSNTVVEWSSNGSQYNFRLANAPGSQTVSSGANTGDWFGDTPSRNNLTIGAIKYGVGGNTIGFLYTGQLAYLGVFNSPLSTQDRYDLYKWIEEYYGITGMPGLSDYEQAVLLSNPTAFWPMRESLGTIANDFSGNNKHLTLMNGPILSSGGPLGRYCELDGSNDYAEYTSGTSLTGEWSAVALVRVDTQAEKLIVGDWQTGGLDQRWILGMTATGIEAFVYNGGYSGFGAAVTLTGGTWNLIGVSRRAGTGTSDLYLNGVSIGTGTIAAPIGASVTRVGYKQSAASPYFNGGICGVAVFPAALTTAQHLALAQAAGVGWSFSDSFDRADSSSTLGSPWIETGGTWGISSNAAYRVTGTETFATILGAPTDIVVSAPINAISSGWSASNIGVVARWQDSNNFYLAQVNGDGRLQLYKRVSGTYTALATATSAGFVVSGDVIALRCVGSEIQALKNGSVVHSVTDSALTIAGSVGMRNDGSSTPRVASFTAVTATAVPSYNQFVASLLPLAHWPMQESSGTTMNALVGSNGTYSNSPTLAVAGPSAKIPNGVSFDGTNDYASAAIDLSAIAEVTVSFWLWTVSYSADDRMALELSATPNSTRSFSVDPNYWTGGRFAGTMASGGGAFRGYGFTRPSTGAWHHYAVRFSRSAQTVTFVVDGVVQTMTAQDAGAVSGNFISSTLYFMSRGGASNFCAGRLAQVAVFSGLLSDANCAALYTAGISGV